MSKFGGFIDGFFIGFCLALIISGVLFGGKEIAAIGVSGLYFTYKLSTKQ